MSFDHLALGDVNRAREVHLTASGKSLNVTRVVHMLQHPVLATGFLGGAPGRFIRRDLDGIGIAHDFVEVDPPTRSCITLLDRAAGVATELVEESQAVVAGDYDALLDRLSHHLPPSDVLVLSGSLPPGGPEDFYHSCTKRAARQGVKVILDASGPHMVQALSARPFIVKPNRAELARTFNRAVDADADLHDAMRQTIAAGAVWVIVTLGASGARLTDGHRFWRITPPAISAINPIGSGDAFAAGLAVAVGQGQSPPDAARLATACAAANALTDIAGFVHPDVIAELLPHVQVEAV